MIPDTFLFLRPWWFLALVPLAGLVWALVQGGPATGAWQRVCDPALLHFLAEGENAVAAPRRAALAVAVGGLLAVVALAGPAWERLPQPVYRGEATRVVVLSLAGTMNAADLKPSRLARARFKVMDLLERAGEGRTGLVVYAGEPFIVSPLTDDAATIAAMVPVLETDLMPAPGRRLAPALEQAAALLDQGAAGGGRIIVLADGMDDPAAALERARDLSRRHTIGVIGVGTPDGVPVTDAGGGFRRDGTGALAVTRLEESALEAVAAAGGGAYRRLTADDADLRAVMRPPGAVDGVLEASDERTADQWCEAGPWLLLPLALLGAFAFRRGWLAVALVAVMGSPGEAWALDWEDLWRTPDQQAAAAFQEGQPAAAAKTFRDPAWRGSALYRAGEYEAAAAAFEALGHAGAHYNRANALARGGRLEEALAAYEQALELAPGHDDARHNLAVVRRALEQQAPQEGQQGEGESGDPRQQSEPAAGGGQGDGSEDQDTPSREQDDGQAGAGDDNAGDQTPGDGEPSAGEAPAEDDAGRDPLAEPGSPGEETLATPPGPPKGTGEQAPPEEPPLETSGAAPQDAGATEADQAMEQWLRRIPDDPGGLLRRKFMLEHYRRQQAAGGR
ncbi:MAG: VWA domain-containing protein [Gammaproteobacteria bacterium]|nr:VWA domain-containing protein [Gammaproteobacteria bacterium]